MVTKSPKALKNKGDLASKQTPIKRLKPLSSKEEKNWRARLDEDLNEDEDLEDEDLDDDDDDDDFDEIDSDDDEDDEDFNLEEDLTDPAFVEEDDDDDDDDDDDVFVDDGF